ncbi:MAG: response regulator [Azonexus sp.]|nr:response regulator [Azonexus sp.]
MNDKVSNTYCTTREAAKTLGVSVRTVQVWVEKGLLRAWKTEGGHRRVERESVMQIRDLRLQGEDLRALPLPIDRTPAIEERLKVLVVEDNNTLLRLYRLRLESWKLPIDVVTAPNAIEGLLLVGRVSPDLLVTDLNMPGLDGMTMVRTISHSPFREGMEIVVVTGLSHEEIEELGPFPADIKIFQKPIPFQELKQICEELLRQRRSFGQHA